MKMLKWPLKSSFRDRGCHTEKEWRSENKWGDVENAFFLQGGTSHEMRKSSFDATDAISSYFIFQGSKPAFRIEAGFSHLVDTKKTFIPLRHRKVSFQP